MPSARSPASSPPSTGQGMVTPTIGNQGWFEYGGRLGYRISKGWVADLFVNGTLGPQPVGNTIHGGIGLRINTRRPFFHGLDHSRIVHRLAEGILNLLHNCGIHALGAGDAPG